MAVKDYRDDDPLSDAILEAYADGLRDGGSWGSRTRDTEARDYAVARADRLEARVRELESRLHTLVAAAKAVEAARPRRTR